MPAADSLTEFHEREKDSSPIRKSATCKDRSSSESPRSGVVEGSHEDPERRDLRRQAFRKCRPGPDCSQSYVIAPIANEG